MHLGQDIGQGFGGLILGAHAYTWGVLLFIANLLIMSLLLGFSNEDTLKNTTQIQWGNFHKFSGYSFIIVIFLNVIQAFTQVGPPPYIGQGSPQSFSYDLSKTVWKTKHWPTWSHFSFRANNYIEQPEFNTLTANVNTKLEHANELLKIENTDLPADVIGRVTAISYDEKRSVVVIATNKNWIYLLDNTISKILSSYNVDPKFDKDVSNIAGVFFDKNGEIIVTSAYKSYVKLSVDDLYRMKEVGRGNLKTVRANKSYIGSSALSLLDNEYLTLSLPNKVNKYIVLSRFSRKDMVLNAEQIIPIKTKDAPVITGMTVTDKAIILLNNSGKQLIVLDKKSNKPINVYDIDDANNPQGMTIIFNKVLITDEDSGKKIVKTYLLPI
ncbi:putative ATP /GTP binding protein [Photobacterium sp. SKA34]|nr:putative ATP /GTP binding protein [Photobacterium sp. SKA34]